MARKIIFGSYDTDTDWGLTLTGYKLSDPEYKASFVAVPGRDGDLDLSTALTDGEPRYNNRSLVCTFETSNSNRDRREILFSTIRNTLDGFRYDVVLPDDPEHYVTGRLSVAIEYNDLNHGALTISGICEPWRYSAEEQTVTLTATTTAAEAILMNRGRRIVVPTLVVTGSVTLECGESTWTLSAGTWQLPDLVLVRGATSITYSGSGSVTFKWREAIL